MLAATRSDEPSVESESDEPETSNNNVTEQIEDTTESISVHKTVGTKSSMVEATDNIAGGSSNQHKKWIK